MCLSGTLKLYLAFWQVHVHVFYRCMWSPYIIPTYKTRHCRSSPSSALLFSYFISFDTCWNVHWQWQEDTKWCLGVRLNQKLAKMANHHASQMATVNLRNRQSVENNVMDDSRVAHRGCYIVHVMSSSVLRIRMITEFLSFFLFTTFLFEQFCSFATLFIVILISSPRFSRQTWR